MSHIHKKSVLYKNELNVFAFFPSKNSSKLDDKKIMYIKKISQYVKKNQPLNRQANSCLQTETFLSDRIIFIIYYICCVCDFRQYKQGQCNSGSHLMYQGQYQSGSHLMYQGQCQVIPQSFT